MKWYTGDIASAITLAKTRGSIFVVYSEGPDENSKQLTEFIETETVSAKLESQAFVSIKIKSDQPEYVQFAKIYQLVPIPSIFFIKNGVPLKIVAGVVKSASELEETIDTIMKTESSAPQSSSSLATSSPAASAPPADDSEIVCEGGVCYKKPKTSEPGDSSQSAAAPEVVPEETEEEKQERIKKAMKVIEQKRIEKIQEEKRLEREAEIQRRKEGQELQNLKKWQDDQELKQIKDDRIKEKQEAKAARQRVLDQIEQDKKERAARFAMQTAPAAEPKTSPVTPPANTSATSDSNTAKIQFKKPNGESEVVTFDSDMIFADLHLFVKNDILRGAVKDFALATSFPRREFAESDFSKTLKELNLTPSSVLLIIIGKKPGTSTAGPSNVLPTNTDGSFFSMISALFFGLLTPVVALFTYLKGFVFRPPVAGGESASDAGKRKRNEEILTANDAAKKRNLSAFTNQQPPPPSTSGQNPTGAIPKSGVHKRQNPSGNIHRLHQDSESDEDKKTYNGNSTQQL